MEVFVYSVYFVGILAAFSALIVHVIASLPVAVLMCGEHAGRFAELGAPQLTKLKPAPRLRTIDLPKARAA